MESLPLSVAGVFFDWIWPILQFVIGLGLVIFVHELGHFLVAKAVGIKVERFALGFGPRLFGIVRGETDYCVNALPLGGYVKMLGQEDFKPVEEGPARHGAAIEHPALVPPPAAATADPRSYNSKSVGARFLVIAAGVVMNVIFAAALFVLVCLIGKDFPAPVVGEAAPGWPAATAKIVWDSPEGATTRPADSKGLKPGDLILAIDGDPVKRFSTVAIASALARRGQVFAMRIQRDVNGSRRVGTATVGVEPLPGGMLLGFGLIPAQDLVLEVDDDQIAPTPFESGDRIVAVNGRRIDRAWELPEITRAFDGSPVTVTVRRDGKELDPFKLTPILRSAEGVFHTKDGLARRGEVVRGDTPDNPTVEVLLPGGTRETFAREEVSFPLNDTFLDILGMTPRFRFAGVVKGSPAHKAGLKPGDVVLSYGDHPRPTHRQFREINRQVVDKETTLVVLRDGKGEQVTVTPKERNGTVLVGVAPALDLAHPVVAAVRPGSLAAKAGIEPLTQITAVQGFDPNTGREVGEARPIASWIDLHQALCDLAGKKVAIHYRLGDDGPGRVAEIGLLDKKAFDPAAYAYHLPFVREGFRPLMVRITERNPLKAVAWGVRETGRIVVASYASLRALIMGTASHKTLMGPVGIGGQAVDAGRRGIVEMIYVMAFISAAIAVFNFLPIPVVDGGHAVFLILEKIRGRPLPVKVMNVIQMSGLVLLLGVFVAVTWNDIARLVGGLW